MKRKMTKEEKKNLVNGIFILIIFEIGLNTVSNWISDRVMDLLFKKNK